MKKIVLEDLAHRGEIEKIHIKRGTGGEDEQGNKLDFVSRKGLPRSPAKTGIVSKQAWVWQLKEIPPLDPMTSAAPEKPNIEEEEEDDDLFLASPEGWTKKNLRFVNVKHVDLKRYEAPA